MTALALTTEIVRYAAVIQLLFIILQLSRRLKNTKGVVFIILLALSAIGDLLCPVAYGFSLWNPLFYIIFTACFSFTFHLWLLSRSLFDDSFRWHPLHLLILLGVVGVSFTVLLLRKTGYVAPPSLGILQSVFPQIFYIALVALAALQSQKGRDADLIEARRQLRVYFILILAAVSVTVLAFELALKGKTNLPELSLLKVGTELLLVYTFTYFAFQFHSNLLESKDAPEDKKSFPETETLLPQLTRLMEEQKLYREEGLTIRVLARKMEEHEYKLRRLINSNLNFKNFNDYLNRYRVQEACEILGDPEQDALPIVRIAMDLGYRSLAPFNRAFREQTGKTPTAYRKSR